MYCQCRIALRDTRKFQVKIDIFVMDCNKEKLICFVNRKGSFRTIAENMAKYTVFLYN